MKCSEYNMCKHVSKESPTCNDNGGVYLGANKPCGHHPQKHRI